MDFLIDIALLPPVFFLVYVYRKDRVEKEPIGLLLLLLLGGILSCGTSFAGETFMGSFLPTIFDSTTILYLFIDAFLGIALIEEGSKFVFLHLFSWKNKNFNCTFDGLIYSVFVSLGFAAGENVLYVINYGLENALMRAVTSIPGHLAFSIFMGLYYAKAKEEATNGNKGKAIRLDIVGLLLSITMHGLYDGLLMVENTILLYVWFGLLLFLYITIFVGVHRASKKDHPID